jgi:hypothetical protein
MLEFTYKVGIEQKKHGIIYSIYYYYKLCKIPLKYIEKSTFIVIRTKQDNQNRKELSLKHPLKILDNDSVQIPYK